MPGKFLIGINMGSLSQDTHLKTPPCYFILPLSRCAVPDLLPRGRKVYAQGMGTHAMGLVLAWLKQAQPGLDLVVDPFCGRGTVLALSNGLGLRALGLELDAGCARSARRLDLAKLAEHGDQPVAFYLQRAREGREKKRRNAE
ncbi:unnamed protein product [Effrenium voratum]|nr:unnamed protein product [Effrenium voratum]